MALKIKLPVWSKESCVATEHIETPEGWLGYRTESGYYVVTGIFNDSHCDDERFKTVKETKNSTINELIIY